MKTKKIGLFCERNLSKPMIPPIYQTYIDKQLSARQSLLLSLLVPVLHSIRDVRLEAIAEALPLPILFESRRKKFNGSLRWGQWM